MDPGGESPTYTWRGRVETTNDALRIFQACLNGVLPYCSRRPNRNELSQLIISGNVFVYNEANSGLKRWTDGIDWSPSRLLTNFLIYRQLTSSRSLNKKRTVKKRSHRVLKTGKSYVTSGSKMTTLTAIRDQDPTASTDSTETRG